MLTFDEIEARIKNHPAPRLVAIDGFPCSGKSTLALRLIDALGFDCIYLDDFVMPETEWLSPRQPAFPFPYIRYDAFVKAVQDVHRNGLCTYFPFDWETMKTATQSRTVKADKPILVEGVSSLNPILAPLYDLKIYVDSDEETTLASAITRSGGNWESPWRDYFMPSALLYFKTNPRERADLIAAGRGITPLKA